MGWIKYSCCAIVLLASCGGESFDETMAKLDALRRQSLADIERQAGECRAIAIEFPGAEDMRAMCADSYRLVVTESRKAIEDIAQRESVLREKHCAALSRADQPAFIPEFCRPGRFIADK